MALVEKEALIVESVIDKIREDLGLGVPQDPDVIQRLREKIESYLKPYPNKVLEAGKYYVVHHFKPPPDWGMFERFMEFYYEPIETHRKKNDRFSHSQVSLLSAYP